ncbi:MAG: hypothetical protein IPO81_23555 [Kouleothrix sp.]|nr:hypothetical protein [Kouleothrix sp.]
MRSLRLLVLPLLVMLAVSGIAPTLAAPAPPTPTVDPTGSLSGGSAGARPSGSTPQANDPSILCFTTKTGTFDPCARVSALFSTVTTIRSDTSFPADLTPYKVVYIGVDEGNVFSARASQLQSYVSGGGGLVVSQPNLVGNVGVFPPGFEMTVTSITWPEYPSPPGPVEFTRAGATHPILAGLTPADVSGNFDTIPLSTLGPGWVVLAKSVSYPNVALAAGVYGAGRLVFETGNPSAASIDPGSDSYLRQLIAWAGAGSPPGPDMRITAIEVTQAVQDLNNSVDLVANKRTYARVHVSSPTSIGSVTANLSGERGGVTLFPTLIPGNPGGTITILTTPDRAQINDSFWFELPSSWLGTGNLKLTARLDPANAKNDPHLANNTSSVTVNFLSAAPLRLRIYNVRYTIGGTTYQAASSHLDRLESWLRRAYPISTLSVSRDTFTYPGGGLPNVDTLNTWLGFIKLLRRIFSGEDGRVVYYGMVDDGGGFMRGKAAGIPGTIASGPTGTPGGSFSWDTDGSYGDWYGGHEIGHTRSRYHAEFCGATGGAAYPYPNGRISPALTGATALYGFDILNRAIYDPNWKDVMTYCQSEWVSDFTYEGIRSYLSSVGGARPDTVSTVAANSVLLVSGLVYLDTKTGALDTVNLIQQPQELELPTPGDWTIALVNAGGDDVAAYPFAPQEQSDGESSPGHPAVVSEIVPWVDGAVRVELRYGSKVVDSRSASAHAPVVDITAPQAGQQVPNGPLTISWTASDADSDPLTYSVLYSDDAGASWQPLTTGLSAKQLTINTSQIPGGSQSRVRVVASDGLLSGIGTSGDFSVPTKAPQAQIAAPADNATFYPAQQVVFQGSAYDVEDGQLADASLQWSSSIDGPLGTGATVSTVNLSTGTHVITLVATDSEGKTSQAQRTITVASGSAPVPSELTLAPLVIGAVAPFGAGKTTAPLTVRSSGADALSWTASANRPWVKLSATSGTTPANLTVTVDPAQLAPGDYQAIITFTSGSVTKTVPVALTVTGTSIYLSLLHR